MKTLITLILLFSYQQANTYTPIYYQTIIKTKKVEPIHKYYFTDYDLGDSAQNDSTPCIGASGKDLCQLTLNGINTIALVNIKRWEMGISFGDEVELTEGPCPGIYEVHDEMNQRYRQKTPIYRPGTNWEIRGDIARFRSSKKCQGAYKITKIHH